MKISMVRKEEGRDTYFIYFDNGGRLTLHDWSDKTFPNLKDLDEEEESWLYMTEGYKKKEEVIQAIKSLEVWEKILEKIPHKDLDIGTDTYEMSSGIPISKDIVKKILNKTLEL